MKSIIPLFISSLLIIIFTLLLLFTNKISGSIYLGLVSLALLVGIVIYFRDNIREIDMRNMRVILQKTQRVKEEVGGIALSLAKIVSTLSAYSTGSWLNRKRLNDEIEGLLTTLSVDASEKKKILDLPRTVEKMMKGKESLTLEEKKKVDDMFSLEEDK